MAQSMKDIKRRINSIGSIMQITNAMELVSSAKLRKARQRLEKTRPYYNTVYENIREILLYSEGESEFFRKRQVKKRALLIISSNRGLAGGYNVNVVKKAISHLNDGVENTIYVTGKKSIEALKKTGEKIVTEFTKIGESPNMEDAMELGNFLTKEYENKNIDELIVVYTKFNSVLSLEPQSVKLLPSDDFEKSDIQSSARRVPIEFEPSAEVVLDQMIRQYVNVSIYGFLLESSTAEQASRRTAMENATSNGEDLLEDLELIYNRARQAAITQEISEIVGGAEALK